MADSQKQELAKVDGEQPTAAKITPTPALVKAAYEAIEGSLPDGVLVEVGDPEVTARAIRERIRQGKTFDDVFAPQKLPKLADLAGEGAVIVRDFHFNVSKFDETPGSSVYAVVEVARADGTIELRHCGGGNVLTQLVMAWEHGWFPFKAKVVAKETGNAGRTTLYLEKADAA